MIRISALNVSSEITPEIINELFPVRIHGLLSEDNWLNTGIQIRSVAPREREFRIKIEVNPHILLNLGCYIRILPNSWASEGIDLQLYPKPEYRNGITLSFYFLTNYDRRRYVDIREGRESREAGRG